MYDNLCKGKLIMNCVLFYVVSKREEEYNLKGKLLNILRTVPTIVIAHTFCASPNTRISYRRCLLMQGHFCPVKNYADKVDLGKYS